MLANLSLNNLIISLQNPVIDFATNRRVDNYLEEADSRIRLILIHFQLRG